MSINVQERVLKIPIPLSGTEGNIVEECSVQLPTGYPAIAKIVYADGIVDFAEPIVELGRVMISGTVDIVLIYQTHQGDETGFKGVAFLDALNFSIPAELADVIPEAVVSANVTVDAVTATVGKGGVINCDVVLAYEIEAARIEESNVVTEIVGIAKKVKVTKDTFEVKDYVGKVNIVKAVDAAISLGQQDPLIAELIRVKVKPKIETSRCLAGKVVIEGNLDVELAYIPAPPPAIQPPPQPPVAEEGEIEGTENEFLSDFEETPTKVIPKIAKKTIQSGVKFVLSADLLGADPEKKVDAKLYVAGVQAAVAANDLVELNVTLKGHASVSQELLLEAVTAAELDGEERIDLNRRMIGMPLTIARTAKEIVVSGNPGIAASKAELKEILFTTAKTVVNQCKVSQDKIAVSGKVRLDLLYVGENEVGEETIDHLVIDKGFEFKEVLELPGVEPGMLVKVETEVATAAVGIVDPFTLEANLLVTLTIEVADLVEKEIVREAAVAVPAPKDSASIRVVVAQKGDTLWKLARKYGTTVEFIAAYNQLGEVIDLAVGQRLRIPSAL